MVRIINRKSIYPTPINLIILLIACFIITGTSRSHAKETPISYTIPYIQSQPVIDGEITEGEWAAAERVNLDNETSPSQNIPALVDTEAFIMEDGTNFYLAFNASDPEPDEHIVGA